METHVIFGTGPVGSGAARLLLDRGAKVRLVNRSGKLPELLSDIPVDLKSRLEVRAADALDGEEVAGAGAGASHIYHCANVLYQDWDRILPTMNRNIVEAARRAGAVVAYAENLYMYARGVERIDETASVRPPSRKGKLRQRLHESLVEAGEKHGLAWTTVRASDFYGPGATGQSVFGTERFLDPLYAGKRPALIGDPDMPHTYTYVGDYSRALVEAAANRAAHGRAWIVPNDRTLTTREVAELFAAAAGKAAGFGRIPRAVIALGAVFSPLLRELLEVLYQKEEPYVVDGSRFRMQFGLEPTPLEEGIRRTIAWYEARRTAARVAA